MEAHLECTASVCDGRCGGGDGGERWWWWWGGVGREAHQSPLKWKGVEPTAKGTLHAGPPTRSPLQAPAGGGAAAAPAPHSALQERNSSTTVCAAGRGAAGAGTVRSGPGLRWGGDSRSYRR